MGPHQLPAPRPDAAPEVFCAPDGPRARWTLVERVLFRFCFAYLILYIFPFPYQPIISLLYRVPMLLVDQHPAPEALKALSEWTHQPYQDAMDKAVLWTGDKVFGVEIEYRSLGSGDTTWNYVQVFLFAVASAAVALLWTLAATLRWVAFGRERPAYPHLHEYLRVYVRFYLAFYMLSYGMAKVIKSQFPDPSTDNLLHTYGESSPMHLLWTFMGASEGYTVFTGAGEMLGGLLLCTRRTTLLGALVAFGVMVHVAALNFCYDVPVKLFSSHLVLMAVFLMAPDLPWLAKVFVLGRRAVPRAVVPLTPWRWLNRSLVALRTVIVLTYVGTGLHGVYKQSKVSGDLAPKPPLYGLWEVEEFAQDGQDHPPLTTDAARWQHLVVRKGFRGPLLVVTPMKGRGTYYPVEVDPEAKTITLSRTGGAPRTGAAPAKDVLSYQEPEPGVIVIDGDLETFESRKPVKHHVRARLRHVPDEKFLLLSRGFHWINEVPYNQSGSRHEEPPKIMPPPKRLN
jgi:hypothetical protein